MIRGDICYHTFKEPDKRRPVLILTRTSGISFLNEITIAPITTTVRKNDSSVWLDESDGMRVRMRDKFRLSANHSKTKIGKSNHASFQRKDEGSF